MKQKNPVSGAPALERVLAGDISLQHALLNTVKPKWLTAVQAARDAPLGKGFS